ncbi:MAG: hypothetical protein NUW06_06245 [Candidatus Acetothermia bacterium]|nr:hypothetical protein [Candidatus Acetothermia bacterium]
MLGLLVGLLALGALFTVAKADTSTTDGIEVGYKADLLAAATDLIDEVHELLGDLTDENGDGTIDEEDGIFPQLVLIKDCKVGYRAALEQAIKFLPTDPADALDVLRPVVETILQTGVDPCPPLGHIDGLLANEMLLVNVSINDLHDSLSDLEEAVKDLIIDIEENMLAGLIGQTTANSLIKKTITDENGLERPYAPLLVIMVLLSDKNQFLVEMDKLFEQAIEYESEAIAHLTAGINVCLLLPDVGDQVDCLKKAIKEAIKALEKSIKTVRMVEGYLWAIKDNIKDIKAWLCGFQQLVIRAPLKVTEEEPRIICPWCLPPLAAAGATELKTFAEPGTIRFAALGGAVQGMRVQVFNLSGRAVFDSGMVAGNMLAWRTYDVANGVYLYTIELQTAGGITRSEVRKLAVVR